MIRAGQYGKVTIKEITNGVKPLDSIQLRYCYSTSTTAQIDPLIDILKPLRHTLQIYGYKPDISTMKTK